MSRQRLTLLVIVGVILLPAWGWFFLPNRSDKSANVDQVQTYLISTDHFTSTGNGNYLSWAVYNSQSIQEGFRLNLGSGRTLTYWIIYRLQPLSINISFNR